jgi:hypothetical protein
MDKDKLFDKITQVALPVFTVAGFALTSLKMPEWSVIVGLIAEIFWFYASWKAWKQAGQIGILITTVIVTIILIYGVLNYWVF